MKKTAWILGILLLVLSTSRVDAAQITEVQDSFEDGHPFGMSFNVRYEFINEQAKILREFIKDNDILLGNKFESTRSIHLMHFDLAIGLYKDLELTVDIPLVISDQSKLDFHPAIKSQTSGASRYDFITDVDNSSAAWNATDADKANTMIDMPFTGKDRAGLGNIGVGLRWAPWSYTRDKKYPNWLLGVLFRLPTGSVKEANNTAVGDGVFSIELNTTISRRVTPWFEPYFDLHGHLVAGTTGSSLFQMFNEQTQSLSKPGHKIGLKLGTEFIPWEVEEKKQHFSIDMGVGLDYVFEGREYTELFEALGASPCVSSNDCMMTTYSRDVKEIQDQIATAYTKFKSDTKGLDTQSTEYGAAYDTFVSKKNQLDGEMSDAKTSNSLARTDGITDVEHYGIYSGWLGFHVQPIEYFALGARFFATLKQPHFITFADPGKDAEDDADDKVTGYNSRKYNEYNPVYLESIDAPGSRFKVDEQFAWTLLFTVTGQF